MFIPPSLDPPHTLCVWGGGVKIERGWAEHLTTEGFKKLVAIKAPLNLGLSEKLKKNFPTIVPVPRPLVVNQVIKDPYWVAGFTSGEGCFLIGIYKSPSAKRQETAGLVFKISQDSRDEQLMKSLVSYFGAGNVYKDGEVISFKIAKFEDLTKIDFKRVA